MTQTDPTAQVHADARQSIGFEDEMRAAFEMERQGRHRPALKIPHVTERLADVVSTERDGHLFAVGTEAQQTDVLILPGELAQECGALCVPQLDGIVAIGERSEGLPSGTDGDRVGVKFFFERAREFTARHVPKFERVIESACEQ